MSWVTHLEQRPHGKVVHFAMAWSCFQTQELLLLFLGVWVVGRRMRASPRRVGGAAGKEVDSWLWEGFLVASRADLMEWRVWGTGAV